jgi:hypothetical protein
MRARTFPTTEAELEQICLALRRAYPPTPRRAPTFTVGHIIFICGVLLVPIVLTPWPWGRMAADPLGDAKLNNAKPDPTPIQVGGKWLTELPDGRKVVATYVGYHNDWKDLPWTGNRVGDARWLWAYNHYFVWIAPLTPANATPTWIDP